MNVLRSYVRKATQRCLGNASMSTTATVPQSTAASLPLPSSTLGALDRLRAQPLHYVIASLMGKRYLLAPRDILTVPRLKTARVGDRLFLTHIHEVGSRDFTLRGQNNGESTLMPGTVRVEATVLEHTKGAMERIVKFKRRKHYTKTVEHKQPYTRLRIGPIFFGQPEEGEKDRQLKYACVNYASF
ncbi:hypothetical protein ACEPAF_533 [Sanghuangporus sanghuang]